MWNILKIIYLLLWIPAIMTGSITAMIALALIFCVAKWGWN